MRTNESASLVLGVIWLLGSAAMPAAAQVSSKPSDTAPVKTAPGKTAAPAQADAVGAASETKPPAAGGDSRSILDAEQLRRKQDAQQRARTLTRELVSNVLNVQLQQLEENGLTELPLYKDIASMRRNLSTLVEKEMGQVVDLLVTAQTGPSDQREKAYRSARQQIREVVMRLSIERQNLMKRLKTAEIAAQVRRLIGQEGKVLKQTKALPELPQLQQEKQALVTAEDQGDVKQLFLQLVDTLAGVSRWDGPIGTGATEGLRILATTGVGRELDRAGQSLETTRYSDAADAEQQVIKGLKLLLEKLEQTQGLLNADRQNSLQQVRQLINKQQELQKLTQQADLTTPEPLIEKQAEIRKDLGQLSQALEDAPATERLVEQAKAAAYEATGKLFDQQQDAAVAEQSKVLGSLAEIEAQLQSDLGQQQQDLSAQQLREQVAQLEKAREEIRQIETQQEAAAKQSVEQPQPAAQAEKGVADALSKVDDNKQLPEAVEARLEKAQEAAQSAAAALEQAVGKAENQAAAQAAVDRANEAVERAKAEIEAALDDAKRQVEAVKVGELARAAETLERAAAAERELARQADQAAAKDGLQAAEAKAMAAEQAEINAVAGKVNEGTKALAPEATKPLSDAVQSGEKAKTELAAAEQQAGAASKEEAKAAANAARQAAGQFEQAAAKLREEIGRAADALAQEADSQLKEVAGSREAVEAALKAAQANDSQKQMSRLEAAQKKVEQAMVDQQKAAGRPEAAAAMQLAQAIREAGDLQEQANAERAELAQGKASSPLEAATAQQAVADAARDASQKAAERPAGKESQAKKQPDAVKQALDQAAQSAAEAAKATLDGNKNQAQAAAAKAVAALDQAEKLATAEVAEAKQKPAGKPDAAAQAQVSKEIADAVALAGQQAPEANSTLAKAEQKSAAAEAAAKQGENATAQAAQAEVAGELEAAAQQLAAASKKQGEALAKDLGEEAKQADQLAKQAATVDPGATTALRDAEEAAQEGAQPPSDTKPAISAAAEAERALERAAANLNAREQMVLRDKAIAEALKQLAKQQQKSAQEIASQRDELLDLAKNATPPDAEAAAGESQPGDGKPGENAADPKAPKSKAGKPTKPSKNKPSAEQISAARKLNEATEQFAQAQRATGQAAEEVSGQSEIANAPLREAMELASNLNPENLLPTGAEGMEAEAPVDGKGKPGQSPKGEAGQTEGDNATSANSEGTATDVGDLPVDQPNGLSQTPGAGQSASGQQTSLGTGFVPNSPEVTAKMMASKEALQQAAAALDQPQRLNGRAEANDSEDPMDDPMSGEAAAPAGEADGQSQNPNGKAQPGQSKTGSKTPNQPKAKATSGEQAEEVGTGSGNDAKSKSSKSRENEAVKNGALDAEKEADPRKNEAGNADNRAGDAEAEARKFREEAWVAKLPPELRQAMRARSQRRAPKGYEERLKRYFQSVD